jgi:hypothetical protein
VVRAICVLAATTDAGPRAAANSHAVSGMAIQTAVASPRAASSATPAHAPAAMASHDHSGRRMPGW